MVGCSFFGVGERLTGQDDTADFIVCIQFLDCSRQIGKKLAIGRVEFIRPIESNNGVVLFFLD